MGDGDNLHVVVFPWLAFGHLIPFLELSKSLARKGHKISFLSTPRNIQRLPKIPPSLAPLIDLIGFPLPPVEGLPDGAEATTDIPPEQVEHLKKASDGLEPAVVRFFEETSPRPDWVILDFPQHWISNVAAKSSVPCTVFSVFPSFSLVFFGATARTTPEEFTTPPDWIPFPTTVAYRLHEASDFMSTVYPSNASGKSDGERFALAIRGSQAVLIRGCEEFDGDWIRLLPDLYKKQVIPVSLLPPAVQDISHGDGSGLEIFEWLDRQKPGSVVYVAFGTEAPITIEQIHKLALGLELSQHPFLWALRRPRGQSPDDVEVLPEGFVDRNNGRGLVCMGWVPQINVLAHKSIGGFLTHCGGSSYIEGLQFGHPLIAFPIFLDQCLNSRFIVEKKMGVEVERREEDGFFTENEVAKAVKMVMDEEDGEQIRATARRMSKIFGDRDLEDRYIDGFVSFLREHKNL